MTLPLFHVDAFTAVAYGGNPAAVCLLDRARNDDWMQRVANEMNLSETAFVLARGDEFDLRWLTPTTEVDLCGHATLATAHVLWSEGRLPRDRAARFRTRSGALTCRLAGDWIEMDFPAQPSRPCVAPSILGSALGARVLHAETNGIDLVAELENEDVVRGLRPDMAALEKIPSRGIAVTARSSVPGIDFVSRFFAPLEGIPEDSVTGSAHCCLGPYWGSRLGKTELEARQVSRRGGVVRVALRGDRVGLFGQAVTTARGELLALE